MRIHFLGANGNVTGSKTFVEYNDFRFIVDCGMVQERDYLGRNWTVCPETPATVDALLLTHAHLDHCGLIPRFVKDGFKGKIYGTPATIELAKLILYDSAHIQEEDVRFKQKRHERENRKGPYPLEPLYTQSDVDKVNKLFVPVHYEDATTIAPGVEVRFHEAGHVLGSAYIEVTLTCDSDAEPNRRLLFSGDLGRKNRPILRDPVDFSDPSRPVDALCIESTYGDRESADIQNVDEQLAEVICKTIARGGKVIMPVFAVERAQEVLYRLHRLQNAGKIPSSMPIFLDSPMAVEATRIFRRHPECFDEETLQRMHAGETLEGLSLLETKEESQKLNTLGGPAIIMSSAGMCNAGRIKHHLANHIGYKKNTICFLGYQAYGTLGRQIVEGAKSVRIHGEQRQVRAEVVSIRGISGHADRSELLAWFNAIPKSPSNVFVLHGELKSSQSLADGIRKSAPEAKVSIPEYGHQERDL
ncbi:MAG: MBL fold metallo-hydrolase [Thermoguttaceae bacterium]|nr:MBL fold metallo-hydrolase [Thermoguttaceae bacterium]